LYHSRFEGPHSWHHKGKILVEMELLVPQVQVQVLVQERLIQRQKVCT
jgi:hypothetical protein